MEFDALIKYNSTDIFYSSDISENDYKKYPSGLSLFTISNGNEDIVKSPVNFIKDHFYSVFLFNASKDLLIIDDQDLEGLTKVRFINMSSDTVIINNNNELLFGDYYEEFSDGSFKIDYKIRDQESLIEDSNIQDGIYNFVYKENRELNLIVTRR